jgi:hypothetical protein
MTVAQLIERLKDMPQDLAVVYDSYEYQEPSGVAVKRIPADFTYEWGEGEGPYIEVVLLLHR